MSLIQVTLKKKIKCPQKGNKLIDSYGLLSKLKSAIKTVEILKKGIFI